MKRAHFSLALAAVSLFPIVSVQAQQVIPAAAPAAPALPIGNLPQGVAVDVNGDKILVTDVNRMQNAYVASLDPNTKPSAQDLADVRKQIIDNLIDVRLLAQEARRRNIVVKPEEGDKALAAFKENFRNDKEFTDWMGKEGKTEVDVRKVITDELTLRQLSKVLTADIVVSNDDIATYYNANKEKFKVPEGVKAHHILLAINPGAPADEKDRVRKRAVDLMKQLKNGADFATLAKANSDDPGSKEDGGDLGAFTRGQMVKPFEDAAFGATAGQIVGPIETQFGFHIIKVDEKLPERYVPLAEVQKNADIKAFLLHEKVQQRLDQTVSGLRAKSRITVSPTA
jgi:peptidyl-prolyl cis-trans isomerase C